MPLLAEKPGVSPLVEMHPKLDFMGACPLAEDPVVSPFDLDCLCCPALKEMD